MRRRQERGFALLAALLIAAVAGVIAGVAVAAALGAARVTASDAGLSRARAAAMAASDLAAHRLSWMLVPRDTGQEYGVPGSSGTEQPARVTVETVGPLPAGPTLSDLGPVVRVTAEASSGVARGRCVALLALRASALPLGVSVVEDAALGAPVVVSGCGVYVGGALRGRERLAFAGPRGAPEDGAKPDLVHGSRWPIAGVHAGAGIWAAGVEVHDLDPLPSEFAADTDAHAGATDVGSLVDMPDEVWLASAREHALDPAGALETGVLHLDRLPPSLPSGEPGAADAAGSADPSAGYLVFVSSRGLDGGLTVVGRRDPAWAPVSVVIAGDAVAGAGLESDVAFTGSLVVTGLLEVATATAIDGHLACRRLAVAAPLAVAVDREWRTRAPVGSLEAVVVARE